MFNETRIREDIKLSSIDRKEAIELLKEIRARNVREREVVHPNMDDILNMSLASLKAQNEFK